MVRLGHLTLERFAIVFFFQAEDGIRDVAVTGVQTCALPISFGPHFSQIREKFGSPHAALLPIGAYEPRWFMASVHMSPAEAVRAHEILAVKTSIAIHHGTFRLADDGLDTPSKELIACQPREGFRGLKNGPFVKLL